MNANLQTLIKIISSLPTLGPKSARRIAITLAKNKETVTKELIKSLKILENLKECYICNNFAENEICDICSNLSRDHNQICIVNDILNLWAIERMGQYEGIFYILKEDSFINSQKLEEHLYNLSIKNNDHKEFIIAMNTTIEQQAKAHYIQSILKEFENITITTLGIGLPIGSELDYLDNGTLSIAFNSRKEII